MTEMHWYNYDTEDYDFIDTPEDYSPYVPTGAARNLFHLYVDHKGWSQLDAALEVLSVCVGDKAP
jgi:hypothetical protein